MRLPSSQGTTIAVHDLGGTGAPLLVCHATGFCGGAYVPLAEALAPHHRVFALDARGHGESTRPADDDFGWGGMADDVAVAAAAVTGQVDGPLHVVGHSMGGAAALLAEHRRPGTFATAYLYEPIVPPVAIPVGSIDSPLAAGARRRREVFGSRAEALWRYAGRRPLSVLQAGSLAAYVDAGFEDLPDGTVRLRCRAEDEARTFAATGAIHTAVVADVAVPTVVAVGGGDPGMVADMAPAVAAALPHATLEHHPGLGHFGPLQDPATVAARIVAHTHRPG